MKKFLAVLLMLLTALTLFGCRSQFGEWFFMDDMNEVNQPPPSKKPLPRYDY